MAKLRHIALIVPDPEKAAKFFEDAFDMKVAGKARRGLYVEPTSAVAAAGLTRLIADGSIRPHERTVLVLTGSGLKASSITGALLNLSARPAA